MQSEKQKREVFAMMSATHVFVSLAIRLVPLICVCGVCAAKPMLATTTAVARVHTSSPVDTQQLIQVLTEDNWFHRDCDSVGAHLADNYFVKLFVFGKNETIVDNNYSDEDLGDLSTNEKLLPTSLRDIEPKPSTSKSMPTNPWASIRTRRVTLLLYCFLGLQVSYLSWGLLQEKIMTTEYVIQSQFFTEGHKHLVTISDRHSNVSNDGQNKETSETYHIKFRNSQFLVLVNRILAFIIAFVALNVKNRQNTGRPVAKCEPPLHQYIYCSLSNILSSWCQYEALKFVSFPTQVLSKACKIMPVMLMSQLIGGKKYRTVEYVFAIAISLGMTIFLLNDHSVNGGAGHHHKSMDLESSTDHYYGGLFILVLYLTFDSFTSNWQTVLFEKYKMSTLHMMASVNFFSILLTSTSLIEQGDLTPAFQ
ncbi:unnamed protein product, partial [Medioppia subpectinata]